MQTIGKEFLRLRWLRESCAPAEEATTKGLSP